MVTRTHIMLVDAEKYGLYALLHYNSAPLLSQDLQAVANPHTDAHLHQMRDKKQTAVEKRR